MKKIIGLFMVMLFCSVSVFAQDKETNRHERKRMDPTKRWGKMAEDLKLDDKQTAEFNKINQEFMEKMKKKHEGTEADREAMKAKREKQREEMMAMHSERNEQMKKIMTDEQYKTYLEKQKPSRDKKKDDMHRKNHKGKERSRKNI